MRVRSRRRSPYPLARRLRGGLLRLFSTRPFKAQRLSVVTLNGWRCKRLILGDTFAAAGIEATLDHFGAGPQVPRLVARLENEVWVEFVEGTPVKAVTGEVLEGFAEFYATLYRRDARRRPLAETPFAGRLQRNLAFLHQAGVLSEGRYAALAAAAPQLAPDRVWVGFDFVDSVLKNFVVRRDGGGICAVDVESLMAGQLLGTGVAKACQRWLAPHREIFLHRLYAAGAPELHSDFPFVELCALAGWTRAMVLERKWRHVDPERFRPFCTS